MIGTCGLLELRFEEAEGAFAGLEWEGDGFAEDEADGADEPGGTALVGGDVDELDFADDAAALELVEGWEAHASSSGEGSGVGVFLTGHAFGGVDEEATAKLGGPGAVLDVLAAVDDEPGPWLADGEGLHRVK